MCDNEFAIKIVSARAMMAMLTRRIQQVCQPNPLDDSSVELSAILL